MRTSLFSYGYNDWGLGQGGNLGLGGNIDPVATGDNAQGQHWPSNRHSGKTNIMFADGHAESAVRSEVISPHDPVWRQRWNYDNQPHEEISWSADPGLDRQVDP